MILFDPEVQMASLLLLVIGIIVFAIGLMQIPDRQCRLTIPIGVFMVGVSIFIMFSNY